MAELKTKPTSASVEDFLNRIEDPKKRADAFAVMALMTDITGEQPQMWGDSIVGFGSYHYRYASGQEGDWPLVGFSPRKQNTTLYLTYGFDQHQDLMARLGKFKTGKACLYINRLSDVDTDVLRELIQRSMAEMKRSGLEGSRK